MLLPILCKLWRDSHPCTTTFMPNHGPRNTLLEAGTRPWGQKWKLCMIRKMMMGKAGEFFKMGIIMGSNQLHFCIQWLKYKHSFTSKTYLAVSNFWLVIDFVLQILLCSAYWIMYLSNMTSSLFYLFVLQKKISFSKANKEKEQFLQEAALFEETFVEMCKRDKLNNLTSLQLSNYYSKTL